MANYKDLGVALDLSNWEKLNENFDQVATDINNQSERINNIVDGITDELAEKIVDSAKIIWLSPVDTYAQLATTYPNPQNGETAMVRADGKVYRFTGTQWKEIQDIDAAPINEVDNRLNAQIEKRTRVSIEDFSNQVPNKNDPVDDWNWSGALQAAIDYLATPTQQGGTITFKDNKKYSFATPVNIYKPYNFGEDGNQSVTSSAHFLGTVPEITLEGGSINSTFLKMSSTNIAGIFIGSGATETKTYFSFSMRNIRLMGNNYQGVPVIFQNTTSPLRMTYENVAFTLFDYGYNYDRTLGQGYTSFTNCQFGRNNNGFLVGGDNTIFINCFVQRNRNYGAVISRTNAFNFFGGKIQYNGIEQGGTQIRVSSSDNVNFWGTYLEPSTSNPPYDTNQGKSLITFDSSAGPECKNFSLNGCYFNGHETRYIGSVNAGTTLSGFTMQNCHFRRLKLISGGSLFYVDRGAASPASAVKIRIDSSNTFTELMDSAGVATTAWRISGYDANEGVVTNNNIVTIDQQNIGGYITKIVGSINAAGTQRLFGRGYNFTKGATGEYTVTLYLANKGTSSGNATFFPVIVTPQNSTNVIPSVTRTDAQTFVVRFRDLTNTLVDTSFSFEATISQ